METISTKIHDNSAVSSFHNFHDFANFTFQSPFDASRSVHTCPAALGFSFAAGTTDGPGVFDFTQNGTGAPSESNRLWYVVRGLLHAPSAQQKTCHHPKTILLDIGEMNQPYAWAPDIVDIQLLRVGQLIIIVSSGEATTMAGRRWKKAIAHDSEEKLGISDPVVLLGAPGNSYVHYIATEEEYDTQRYEGASSLHGPHTLAAHVNLTLSYLPHLAAGSDSRTPVPAGSSPPVNTNNSLNFITPVIRDGTPMGKSFGDVISSHDDGATFRPGDTVSVKFVGANPRNNPRLESTLVAVERQGPGSSDWTQVRSDADWNLVYHWNRKNTVLGTSEVTAEWLIEDDYYSAGSSGYVESGTYRIRYYGDAKKLSRKINAFEGVSPRFHVEV